MVYTTGARTYAITYNGEIYNFRELRRELEDLGHAFHTHSDTEVLIHAYVEWGDACVGRLNGIFAFGLWDETRQRLLLARDHLGVKPLFYAQRGSSVLFGSELKALLAHPLIEAKLDDSGLCEALSFRRTPGSGVFRDVHEVRPGYMITYDRDNARTNQYWSLQSRPHPDDLPTTIEHLRSLLHDIVKRQLIADVPIVAMLSGGLDSSGLTALAAAELQREGRQLSTYSIDFVDSARDFQGNTLRPSLDAPWVKRVSEYVHTRHHTITVDTPELIENLLIPMRAHDLPAGGQIETSLYLLFKAMKQDATVTLSGESADEVFGGYPWYYDDAVLNTPTFPWMAMMASPLRDKSQSWLSTDLAQKIRPDEFAAQQYRKAIAEVPRLPEEDARAARMREIFYLGLTRFLPYLLDRKDRMSMAVGFEARVPFCDYRLVEYVWNIPWEMKTVDNIEKGILRRALADVLPDDARMRRKSAYPSSQNPTYLQAIRSWTVQILDDANAPILPLLNTANVRTLAATRDSQFGGEWAVFFFEHIIQLNEWLKEYHVRT